MITPVRVTCTYLLVALLAAAAIYLYMNEIAGAFDKLADIARRNSLVRQEDQEQAEQFSDHAYSIRQSAEVLRAAAWTVQGLMLAVVLGLFWLPMLPSTFVIWNRLRHASEDGREEQEEKPGASSPR